MPFDSLATHHGECEEMEVSCDMVCGKTIRRGDMKSHKEDCPNMPIKCPFVDAGCEKTLLRKELDEHLETSVTTHLMKFMAGYTALKADVESLKADNEASKAEVKLLRAESKSARMELKRFKSGVAVEVAMIRNELDKPKDKVVKSLECIESLLGGYYLESIDDSITFSIPPQAQSWESSPFTVSPGYSMCIRVKSEATATIMELFLLSGKEDENIKWPLEIKKAIEVIVSYYPSGFSPSTSFGRSTTKAGGFSPSTSFGRSTTKAGGFSPSTVGQSQLLSLGQNTIFGQSTIFQSTTKADGFGGLVRDTGAGASPSGLFGSNTPSRPFQFGAGTALGASTSGVFGAGPPISRLQTSVPHTGLQLGTLTSVSSRTGAPTSISSRTGAPTSVSSGTPLSVSSQIGAQTSAPVASTSVFNFGTVQTSVSSSCSSTGGVGLNPPALVNRKHLRVSPDSLNLKRCNDGDVTGMGGHTVNICQPIYVKVCLVQLKQVQVRVRVAS
jgi:hypothetical protein